MIFAIFVGYMWWVAPSKEEIAERQRVNDSIRQAYMDSVAYADSVAAVKAHLDSLAAQGDTSAQRQLQRHQRGDMGVFNGSAFGDTLNVTVKNEKMSVTLSNMGAQVREVVLSDSQSIIRNDDGDMPAFEFSYSYCQRIHNVMQRTNAGRIFDNTFDHTFN